MFALQWICALALALVTCLSAQPVKREDNNYILIQIGYLEGIITKCSNDIRLYSPSDIKPECMSSAMSCTISELAVLGQDCNITKHEDMVNLVFSLNGKLQKKWNKSAQISSSDCICEMYEQTDVKKFVHNIKSQVQQLNSMY
ncbi:hypothetical protein Q8A67_013427 [Cirrhinus molitorella]|uniref:Interleukin n=1 Tax=Cirrhinus molitorella TaxID=172907 RepID=A0AA88TJ27_9TELE|nr:hypothetical protein Q8A67_013427 [Cirrhinus molitorella]